MCVRRESPSAPAMLLLLHQEENLKGLRITQQVRANPLFVTTNDNSFLGVPFFGAELLATRLATSQTALSTGLFCGMRTQPHQLQLDKKSRLNGPSLAKLGKPKECCKVS